MLRTLLKQAKRGTPCYLAPELFSEGATHSSASDLWALGCVLYEAAMGRPPFLNSSFNQLVHEILNNEPAPIPGQRSGRGDGTADVGEEGTGMHS